MGIMPWWRGSPTDGWSRPPEELPPRPSLLPARPECTATVQRHFRQPGQQLRLLVSGMKGLVVTYYYPPLVVDAFQNDD